MQCLKTYLHCLLNRMHLVDSEDHDSMEILTISKIRFSLRPVKIALLYRSAKVTNEGKYSSALLFGYCKKD